ncbi:Poly(rC)-binding protein 2, partial [Clonorchis sinensis]
IVVCGADRPSLVLQSSSENQGCSVSNSHTVDKAAKQYPPITLRLLVPTIHCGSLIGKGGKRIKFLRQSTGAAIQVASESLPNSSDRTITITGSARAVALCVHHVCLKTLRLRSKQISAQYRPQSANKPQQLGLITQNQVLSFTSGYSETSHPVEILLNSLLLPSFTSTNINLICRAQPSNGTVCPTNSLPSTSSGSQLTQNEHFIYGYYPFSPPSMSSAQGSILRTARIHESTMALPSPKCFEAADSQNATELLGSLKLVIPNDADQLKAQAIRSQLQTNSLFSEASTAVCQSLLSAAQTGLTPNNHDQTATMQKLLNTPVLQVSNQPTVSTYPKAPVRLTQSVTQHKAEMYIPNDLVGCIIGRGGNKINEIRQTSQANIKISSGEENLCERRITITGSFPAVQKAQTMINNSVELHKHLLALNTAMNSVYVNPSDELKYTSQAAKLINQHNLYTNVLDAEPQDTANDVSDELGMESYMRTLSTGNSKTWQTRPVFDAITPPIACSKPKEIRSAPARMENTSRQGKSGPGSSPYILRASQIYGMPQTPVTAAPSLSAADLGRGTQGPKNDCELNTPTRKHILGLIGQLPQVHQHKWLTAFGLENEITGLKPTSRVNDPQQV